jgi:hypothetical protein
MTGQRRLSLFLSFSAASCLFVIRNLAFSIGGRSSSLSDSLESSSLSDSASSLERSLSSPGPVVVVVVVVCADDFDFLEEAFVLWLVVSSASHSSLTSSSASQLSLVSSIKSSPSCGVCLSSDVSSFCST